MDQGSLGHYPAADHPPGSVRDIWDWDGSFYIGSIPEVPHTYNVVGNTNEFGLTIGETTWGGTSNGKQEGAIMDYGSLIWVTLQRAKTAREAITVIDDLTSTYGYSSSGESFSIGDPTEVWLMEIYPKGSLELGAVWVASRVPDGYIGAHANQCRCEPLISPCGFPIYLYTGLSLFRRGGIINHLGLLLRYLNKLP